MEKCGMTREGILRGQIYYKGEHADVAVCSVLRPDLLEEQVEDSISRLVSIIEPSLVALLAIVIGAVLLTVMLPMAGILSSF